jgi:hypothetical protein
VVAERPANPETGPRPGERDDREELWTPQPPEVFAIMQMTDPTRRTVR